jgi:hypothetical protein
MISFIQPIIDFEAAKVNSVLSASEFAVFQQQTLETFNLLRTRLGQNHVLDIKTKLDGNISINNVLLWFCFSSEEAEALSNLLSEEQKKRVILFDFFGENILGLLEKTGFAGLVTSATVMSWVSERDQRFHKMGQGHGLYGLKSLFDSSKFDPRFLEVMTSENYCLFYNYEIHDLGKLLLLYVEQLFPSNESVASV